MSTNYVRRNYGSIGRHSR